jgi:hypothetical protein
MEDFATQFIRGFQAGRSAKIQKEQSKREDEDRKIKQAMLKNEMDRLKIQDQIAARNVAIQNAQLMEGQPARVRTEAADLGKSLPAPTAEFPQPVPEGAPQSIKDLLMGQKIQLQGAEIPARLDRTTMPHEPVQIPGIDAYGVGPVSIQPRTQEEVQAQNLAQLLQKIKLDRLANERTINLPGMGTVTVPKEALSSLISGTMTSQREQGKQTFEREQTAEKEKGMKTRAEIRAGATVEAANVNRQSQERIARTNRKRQWITDQNRLLTQENTRRADAEMPPLSSPPGSEINMLEKTEKGPGPRRWGYGNIMPTWLAQQYMQQAAGDKAQAIRWAEADGWIIEVE